MTAAWTARIQPGFVVSLSQGAEPDWGPAWAVAEADGGVIAVDARSPRRTLYLALTSVTTASRWVARLLGPGVPQALDHWIDHGDLDEPLSFTPAPGWYAAAAQRYAFLGWLQRSWPARLGASRPADALWDIERAVLARDTAEAWGGLETAHDLIRPRLDDLIRLSRRLLAVRLPDAGLRRAQAITAAAAGVAAETVPLADPAYAELTRLGEAWDKAALPTLAERLGAAAEAARDAVTAALPAFAWRQVAYAPGVRGAVASAGDHAATADWAQLVPGLVDQSEDNVRWWTEAGATDHTGWITTVVVQVRVAAANRPQADPAADGVTLWARLYAPGEVLPVALAELKPDPSGQPFYSGRAEIGAGTDERTLMVDIVADRQARPPRLDPAGLAAAQRERADVTNVVRHRLALAAAARDGDVSDDEVTGLALAELVPDWE